MSQDRADWTDGGETMATEQALVALRRLPPRVRGPVERILSRWLGRTLIRTAAACRRIEVFDRAMTIAAQFFSSVLPVLILAATLADSAGAGTISDLLGVPEKSRSIIDEAVGGTDNAAFGVASTFLILASATSLSRALSRSFAVIWRVPRPRTRLRAAWRWLAVVLVLAMAVLVAQSLSQRTSLQPPRGLWPVAISFASDVAVAVFVPWVLLSGRVAGRLLMPGAALFAVVMLFIRPASDAWLPQALGASADRYGPIGLAFTYLAWLYIVSFAFVTAAVLGQVVASDSGRLGSWLRGRHGLPG